MLIYCGAEERLKVSVDTTTEYGETEFFSLGKFNIYDEVAVILSVDSIDSNTILDKIAVPVICLDKAKPSDLTLEEINKVFTISFKILPPPPAEFHDSEESLSIGAKKDMLPSTSIRQINNASIGTKPTKEPNKLSVRLSDIYTLLRSFVIQLSTSVSSASIALETIQLLTQYMFNTSRIAVHIILDLGLESIKAIDTTIYESLATIDDGLAFYRSVVVDCLTSVFDRLKLDLPELHRSGQEIIANAARPWIRFPVRITKPLLKIAISTAQPFMDISKPFIIDPSIQQIMSLRDRIIEYPLMGPAVAQTENIVQYALNEIKDELYPTKKI